MARKSLSDSLKTVERHYIETGKLPDERSPYTMLALSKLIRWEKQPRTYLSPSALQQLANSIKENGLKHPLLVRPKGDVYEVIAGDRRFRGAGIAGLGEVPCYVREMDDEEALEESLSENLDREDLNPIEVLNTLLQLLSFKLDLPGERVCQFLKDMRNEWEHKTDRSLDINIPNPDDRAQQLVLQVFQQHGYSWYSYTCNQLKLRDLPPDLYDAIAGGRIEYSKGLRFKVIKDSTERALLLERAIVEGWTQKEIGEKIKEWRDSLAGNLGGRSLKANPGKRVSSLADRIKSLEYWKSDPDLWKQLEKKLASIERWLDERETKSDDD